MGSRAEPPFRWRSMLRWVSWVGFALACAGVVGIVLVLTVIPRLTGGAALNVLTGSMTPGIPVGSVVLIRPVDPGTLRVGDIATYQISPESRALVTHRIIDIRGTGNDMRFVFKGDANRGADSSPVPPQAIRGEVWFHVPLLGSLRDAVHGMNVVILLAPPLLGIYALILILGGVRDRRRSSTAPAEHPAGPQDLAIDRPLVVARFEHASRTTPGELGRSWGGLVLEATDTSTTLLIAPPDDQLAATLELLSSHEAKDVRIFAPPISLREVPAALRAPTPGEEVRHALG